MKNVALRRSAGRLFSRRLLGLFLIILFFGALVAHDYEPYVPRERDEPSLPATTDQTRLAPVRVEPSVTPRVQFETWRPVVTERVAPLPVWRPDYNQTWFGTQNQNLRSGVTADLNKLSASTLGKAGACVFVPIDMVGPLSKVYTAVGFAGDVWHSATHWGAPITDFNEGIDRFAKPLVGATALVGSWAAPAVAWAPLVAKMYAGVVADAMSRIPSVSGGPRWEGADFSSVPVTTTRIEPLNHSSFDGFTRTVQTGQRTITETRMPDPMDGYRRTTTGSYRVVQTTNVPNIQQFERRWNMPRTQNYTAPVVPRANWVPVQVPRVEIPRTNYQWKSPASVTPSIPRTDWSRVQSTYSTPGTSGNYGPCTPSYTPSYTPTTTYNNYQSYLRSFTPTYNYIQNQYNSYRPLWSSYPSFNSYRPYIPTYTPSYNYGGYRR